jgi:hypothetical protein
MPWKLDLPWNELDHGAIEIEIDAVHPEQHPLREVSACLCFGYEREEVVMVKDWHWQKYYSGARSRASTPSSPLTFSHSFDVVYLAFPPPVAGTAAALDERASGDQIQGLRGRSILCWVLSLTGSRLVYFHSSSLRIRYSRTGARIRAGHRTQADTRRPTGTTHSRSSTGRVTGSING